MDARLNQFLFSETTIEKQQQLTHQFVSDFPDSAIFRGDNQLKFNQNFFFKHKSVYINKHNRFAEYPLHSHQFLELNYMYAGHCTQQINGQSITLNQGDILLMDINSQHSIDALGEGDILINILFQNKDINLTWLESMKSNRSVLFDYLLNGTFNNQQLRKYLLLHCADQPKIIFLLEQILSEYFFAQEYSGLIVNNYLMILLTNLMRIYQPEMVTDQKPFSNALLGTIFQEIEKDFKTLTLQSLADKLNYNKNYLSNLVKRQTGMTFTQLLNKQKMLRAHLLITATRMPIQTVIDEVGYSNRNYFYQQYEQSYHELPTATRLKLREPD